MPRPVADESIGLKILYDGTASSSTDDGANCADIVAIHGMGAHPDETWSKSVGENDKKRWMLIDASIEKARWPGVYDSAVGLIFFGTPFRGTNNVLSQGQILQAAEKLFNDRPVHDENLQILRAGDETLCDLVDSYLRVARQTARPRVACFYEQRVTDVGRLLANDAGQAIKPVILVDAVSGCLDITATTENYPLPRDHFDIHRFGNRDEQGFKALRYEIKKMVEQGQEVMLSRTQSTEMTKYYEVPQVAVSNFVGRRELLDTIRKALRPGEDASKPRVVVLQAMGGQGKSQIALEYCRRSKKTSRGIFWIDASSKLSAERSFASIASELNKPVTRILDLSDKKYMVRFVLNIIENWKEDWLIVYDNYDRPNEFSDVRELIPTSGRGEVIVTSRNEGSKALGQLVPVPSMMEDGGTDLLFQGLSMEKTEDNLKEGLKIVDRLGGLALALAQAAAYIDFNKMTLPEFTRVYEAKKKDVLKYICDDLWEYQRLRDGSKPSEAESAFTTWEMSFQQIQSRDPDHADHISRFLKVSAFLEPSNIGDYLFYTYHKDAEDPFPWMSIFTSLGQHPDTQSDSDADTDTAPQRPNPSLNSWSSESFWNVVQDLRKLSLLQSVEPEREEGTEKAALG
ncbi:MAG: hypothetical protein M4579_007127 [Chaenotheca gracillima]|nr:MAG: hypothetical protein M4579_007127 [Chaenotheca gracillima]